MPIGALQRTSNGNPAIPDPVLVIDPRPATGSPLATTNRKTPSDGFYTAANYKGAFAPGEDWAKGWSEIDRLGLLQKCVNGVGTVPDEVPNLSFVDKSNLTWTRFVNDASFRPEIYTWGHRNSLALIVHPVTGELWNSENGPNGGDEVNIIKAGKNYGWPAVSMGRSYEGPWQGRFEKDGMEGPLVYWMPAVAAAGMAIYTGDRFPAWRNNLFIGAMRVGEIPNTGHLERVVFNEKTEEIRRESLLWELRQRIRDVRQGPDGLLYLLTDENPGALLKIEPSL